MLLSGRALSNLPLRRCGIDDKGFVEIPALLTAHAVNPAEVGARKPGARCRQ
jgi:hypothetical protein